MKIKKHIPNAITCCNLMCGCYATACGFWVTTNGSHYYLFAVLAILMGAIFDFFDGMVARLLGVKSDIGKELDSLADVVTFGVAPSAMLFSLFQQVYYPSEIFSLEISEIAYMMRTYLPYSAFLLAAFSALRLAKFNLDSRQTSSFIGLPTPANALFWSSLILGQYNFLLSSRFNALFLLAFIILFCMLLVVELPLFALKFKNFSWQDNKIKYIFLIGCFILICPGSLLMGYSTLAAIILWYLLLNLLTARLKY